ncbi:MAG: hypothetical protein GPOALKHO_001288 [Sodalis sp.]|nr:MAG: hypothetical protein GPOALKHO_001288 [Sodalis sp.]
MTLEDILKEIMGFYHLYASKPNGRGHSAKRRFGVIIEGGGMPLKRWQIYCQYPYTYWQLSDDILDVQDNMIQQACITVIKPLKHGVDGNKAHPRASLILRHSKVEHHCQLDMQLRQFFFRRRQFVILT